MTGLRPLRIGDVCSGVAAGALAVGAAGLPWQHVFFAEIEKFPSAVLAHHYGHVTNLGDFTRIGNQLGGPIDILIGGTPCQDYSVAGTRAGMAGARGGLTKSFLDLAEAKRPYWLFWENVPGLYSNNEGQDFGAFLWEVEKLGYFYAWRTLDAQYSGVPQRRRRIMFVAHLGDPAAALAVLFEPQSLSGYHPSWIQARQDAARRRVRRRDRPGVWRQISRCFQQGRTAEAARLPEVAATLTQNESHAGDHDRCTFIPEISRCITTGERQRQDYETCTLIPAVAHTLRGEGHDASEDGTGRGVPLVPVGFTSNDYARDAVEGLSPTLRAGGHVDSHANSGVHAAVAFAMRGRKSGAEFELGGDLSNALRASQGGGDLAKVCASSLAGIALRNLTPRECERLMAMPDDYTNISSYRKRIPEAEWAEMAAYEDRAIEDIAANGITPWGPRYKAIGNSWNVKDIQWIFQRIAEVDAALIEQRGVSK